MAIQQRRNPHFFKVLLGDFAQMLRIPPNFVKHISKETSKTAIIKGPNSSTWHVDLGKSIKGMYLLGGWQNFVRDNSLKEFEFLVFRYEGKMHFSVQVFDTSACEREDLLTIKRSTSSSVEKKHGRSTKNYVDSGCLVWDKVCKSVDPAKSRECSASIRGRSMPSPKPDRRADIKLEDIKLEQVVQPILTPSSNDIVTRGYFSRRPIATCEREKVQKARQTISTAERERVQKARRPISTDKREEVQKTRPPISTDEREKVQKAANSFRSDAPYFVTWMRANNLHKTFTLRIPTKFARAHLPSKRTQMVLRDPKGGRCWVVSFIHGKEFLLSAGWSAFVRGNTLEEGDFCIFELVGLIELHVHIFRVNEETTPPTRPRKRAKGG